MTEHTTIELRRPDGNLLSRWIIPRGTMFRYDPFPSHAPRGICQWWVDEGDGFQKIGGDFEYRYRPINIFGAHKVEESAQWVE